MRLLVSTACLLWAGLGSCIAYALPQPGDAISSCNVELTDHEIIVDAPFFPAAIALKAAEKKDLRVAHSGPGVWEWNYHADTDALLPRDETQKPKVVHAKCEAVDAAWKRTWVEEGGQDIPAATLVCALNNHVKNGERTLYIALNPDLQVLAAKQLWRKEDGKVPCLLPSRPPEPESPPRPHKPGRAHAPK